MEFQTLSGHKSSVAAERITAITRAASGLTIIYHGECEESQSVEQPFVLEARRMSELLALKQVRRPEPPRGVHLTLAGCLKVVEFPAFSIERVAAADNEDRQYSKAMTYIWIRGQSMPFGVLESYGEVLADWHNAKQAIGESAAECEIHEARRYHNIECDPDLSIDVSPDTLVSRCPDGSYWVQGWFRVPKKDPQ